MNRLARYIVFGAVICGVVALGTVIRFSSHAATPYATLEPENGTVSAGATASADTAASGGRLVNFAAATSPSPSPTPTPGGFQSNCITSPHVCGYPDATNTGVPAGTALITSGSVTATTNGQVISNLSITDGQIVVHANNVIIKNTRISGCTYYPIDYDNSLYSGLIIQDTEIASSCSQTTAGMSFSGYTAIRMNVHGTADGFKADNNVSIEDSYIHDLAVTASSHNDGVQSTGGGNVTFKHNTCDNNMGGVCIQFGSADTNWQVTNNLIRATGWTISGSNVSSSSFTGNRFVRMAVWYGPASIQGSGNTWSSNIYDDTGAVANQ